MTLVVSLLRGVSLRSKMLILPRRFLILSIMMLMMMSIYNLRWYLSTTSSTDATLGDYVRIMGAAYHGDVLANGIPPICLDMNEKRDYDTMKLCFAISEAIWNDLDSSTSKLIEVFDRTKLEYSQRSEILIRASTMTEELRSWFESSHCIARVSQEAENASTKCVVPVVDPFSSVAMAHFERKSELICGGEPYFTSFNGTMVNVVRPLGQGSSANYSVVEWFSDMEVKLSSERPISDPVPGRNDFVQVKIVDKGKEYTELLWTVNEKPSAGSRKGSRDGLPFNIAMVGFDSVSAAEFQRQQPAAYRLLMEELGGIQLTGYNIVGDGTAPNLLGILTGFFESELPEGRRGYNHSDFVDEWPWIFKEFEKNGWVTSYGEEDCPWGTFQYRLEGFKRPPTDHYSHPFFLLDQKGVCIGPTPAYKILLDQTAAFLKSYRGQRKFVLSFASRLTHNRNNYLSRIGSKLVRFVSGLREDGYLNDTILVVFGDHGVRNGRLRSTHQGSLEERLPFFVIVLPNQFRTQFPEFVRSLEQNSKQLTSPFDIHQTLRHIISYPRFVPKPQSHGLSLLLPLPNRDCKEASIPEHHCSCLRWRPLPNNTNLSASVASAVVFNINSQLDRHPAANRSCHRHTLSGVSSLDIAEPRPDLLHFLGPTDEDGRSAVIAEYQEGDMVMVECRYRVVLVTLPAQAVFEATVLKQNNVFKVIGEVSRISKYGDQPACLQAEYPQLRTTCTCLDYVI